MRYCLVIPHYNHESQFVDFLPKILKLGIPCIIVDDGSWEESIRVVREFVASDSNVHLLEHTCNRGKGAAVKTGFYHARFLGFTHAVQIDADGQHCVDDIKKFIAASSESPKKIICGRPVFDDSVPKVRLYGRKVTDFLVVFETLSRKIKDGLCGFRVYPLFESEYIMDNYFIGSRMDFDTEILVKALWAGVDLEFINTNVIYPEVSVSHFKYMRDNLLLVRLHTRLITGMIIRLPVLLSRAVKRKY